MKKLSFVLAMVIMCLTGISLKAQNGWMISSSSGDNSPPPYYIWHTTDGGSHWVVQYTDSTQGYFNAIQFTDLNNGWVVGRGGKILKTINGGSNWTPITNAGIASSAVNKAVFFIDANMGWIGSHESGYAPVVLHTDNGGATSWSMQNVPIQYDIFSVYFVDANNGWFSGEQCVQNCNGPESLMVWNGVIGHTTTGGESGWVLQSNPLSSLGSGGKVQFVSSTEGWISEATGQLLHTTNAGANWSVVTPFPNDTVMSMSDPAINMSWVSQTHGWKINWFGTGFGDAHGAVIYQTTDGGVTWARKVLSTAAGDLGIQVQFVDENNGWATVANLSTGSGSFLRTTDGGNSWNPITMTQLVGGIYYYVDAGTGVKGSLADKPVDNPIAIFPNPAHGAFYITFKHAAAKTEVEMYNAYGAKVFMESNVKRQTSHRINASKYSKGIYFVKISNGENIHTEKIVIQ
jgi:photosystem II stability/assembly factor-like uncharacterized protein